ncbi:MAG: anti-sigma regulatory factor [Caldilineae bacterium]|nr:MAG: anti-sigma regulatory factor [Caldilineae bacterium]
MKVLSHETLPLRQPEDVVLVRNKVRNWMQEEGYRLIAQTRLATAVSELARNALDYGGGGVARLEKVQNGSREGIRVVIEDRGPGIADVEQAMRDGYTTGSGMGLGLGGARRLVDEFEIWSQPGQGTRVTIVQWR